MGRGRCHFGSLSAVGDRVVLRYLGFPCTPPKHQIGLVFALCLLETVEPAAMEESGGGNRRRRPPTPMEEAPVRRGPITQDESRFGAGESGLSRHRRRRRRRPRRSGTHSQSQASSSVAPPVDGGAADPDSPTGLRVVFSDGRIHGVYTREFLREYLSSQSRQRPETRSQAPSSSSAPRSE